MKAIRKSEEPNEDEVFRLMMAARHGRLDTLREWEYDLDVRDSDGSTALMEAAFFGNVECVEWLAGMGCDIDAVDEGGESPLRKAAGNRKASCVAVFLKLGANVELADDNGWTPLMASSDDPEVLRMLLDHGARLDPVNKDGLTALGWISNTGRASRELCAGMLKAEADRRELEAVLGKSNRSSAGVRL